MPVALVALLMLACGEPTVTGPTAMVGRIQSAGGQPVQGLDVRSLEASDRTDAEGRFAVLYKAPEQHVTVQVGDTWLQRRYLPGDEGQVVQITLPETRDVTLSCGEQTCDATLLWTLSEGLEARVTRRCRPGVELPLKQIPTGSPTLSCRGAAAEPTLVDRGDVLALGPPLRPLRIELRSTDGPAPKDCTVAVGERPARPAGEGFWASELAEPSVVAAVCMGRPARPLWAPPDAGAVVLEWSPGGPSLDLEEVASWANVVVVQALASPDAPEDAGWSLRVTPTGEGVFLLPPLLAGHYRVQVHGDAPSVLPTEGELRERFDVLPPADGVLRVQRIPGGETLVGELRTSGDLLEGRVPVEVL